MHPELTRIAVEDRQARLRADYAASRRNAAAWRAFVLRLRRVLGWALVDAGIRIAAVSSRRGALRPPDRCQRERRGAARLSEIDQGARRLGEFGPSTARAGSARWTPFSIAPAGPRRAAACVGWRVGNGCRSTRSSRV